MWLFTQPGFSSIIADRNNAGRHLVRARVRGDLEKLKTLAGNSNEIRTTPGADSAFRIMIDEAGFIRAMNTVTSAVDYPNCMFRMAQRPDQLVRSAISHRSRAKAAQLPS